MPRHSLSPLLPLLPLLRPSSIFAAVLALPIVLHGCATAPSDAEVAAKAASTLKSSFKEQGQAKLDRLDQDDTQKACSLPAGKALPKDVAARIDDRGRPDHALAGDAVHLLRNGPHEVASSS